MRTRDPIVRAISIITCAIWLVSLAAILDPEPAGFHTELDTQRTMIAESEPDIENCNETASDRETVIVLSSDGASGTDPATDPPPSRRYLLRAGLVSLPSAVRNQIATTVLRP